MANQKSKKKTTLISVIVAVIVVVSAFFTHGPQKIWKTLINNTDIHAPAVSSVLSSDAAAQELSVHYIDVNQGDSTLIRFKNYNILIDCAKKAHEENVFDYLEKLGVEHLDLVIATHPDSDHIGGFADLLYRIKPALCLMPQLPDNIKRTQTELTLVNTLRTLKVKTEYALNGKEYHFDDLTLVTYLTDETHEDKNDYSIVTKITYKNASYLFMGDAGKTVEKELMARGDDVSANILKAGHHGSSKSSAEKFVKYVNPSICVFSCGLNNDYGHPHSEVLQLMKKLNINIFRTDLQGTIVIGTDGTRFYTASEK